MIRRVQAHRAQPRVRDDVVELHRLRLQPVVCVFFREEEQVADEPRHVLHFLGSLTRTRLPFFRRQIHLQQVEVAADDHQRPAQLVRRVGEELALAPDVALQALEQRVQRAGQRGQLVVVRGLIHPQGLLTAAFTLHRHPLRHLLRARPRHSSRRL